MDKVEKAFNFWISQYPESYHPLDTGRFYALVDAVAEADSYIDRKWLAQKILENKKHRLKESQIQEFLDEFEVLVPYAKHKRGQ